MADKRITDFATAAEAQDGDLLLISSEDETYNIKVKTIKDAVQGNAERAEAAAAAAQKAAERAAADVEATVESTNEAASRANQAAQVAFEAAQNALEAAQRLPVNIIVKNVVIPVSGWSDEHSSAYALYTDVPVDEATATQAVGVALSVSSLDTAKKAGICQTAETRAGCIRFWSTRQPDTDMSATVMLFTNGAPPAGSGGSGGSGGDTYVLPAATSTRLGGVKIGENVNVENDGTISVDSGTLLNDAVASDGDVKEMLDGVFDAGE